MKKKILIIFMVILLIVSTIAISAFLFIKGKMNKINVENINTANLGINETEKNNPINNYRNIAILGIDSRYNDYEDFSRTDCIMIASINKNNNDVNLFSIYRDTLVQMDLYNKIRVDKINHAYYGGVENTLKTINENFDLNVKEYVMVDFEAVAKVVDQVGGIELNITADELKYINGYIKGNNQANNSNSKSITNTGLQKVDGNQALAYARIRYTEGSDYKRAERMRTVLTKVFDKIKKKDIFEINKIVNEMLPTIKTNLSQSDILDFSTKVINISLNSAFGFPYKCEDKVLDLKDYYEGTTKGKDSYTVPLQLTEDVKRLHQELFKDNDYKVPDSLNTIWENIKTQGKVK